MEYVSIEEGVASSFKDEMQKVYDFLVDCEDLLSSCNVLEKLNFDGGNIAISKNTIATMKGDITSLLSQVLNCEEELIQLDENGSRRLDGVFDLTIENEEKEITIDEPIIPKDDNGGSSYQPPFVPIIDPTDTVEPIIEPPVVEIEPYKFSEDHDEAYRLGDIFIDDKMSLTKFTNMLLERYEITDEKMAKKIYQAVLIYGNEFFHEYGQNPLNILREEDIMSSLYDILKKDLSYVPKDNFWESLKDIKINTEDVFNA